MRDSKSLGSRAELCQTMDEVRTKMWLEFFQHYGEAVQTQVKQSSGLGTEAASFGAPS